MERLGEISVEARCGDGMLSGDGGAEYPCVRRFRHRRLIAFLWLNGFKATAKSMLVESEAILSVPRLQRLVQLGLWRDALGFLSRFLPLDSERPLSIEAEVLHRFLGVHMALDDIVDGTDESTVVFYCQYLSDGRTVRGHGAVRLRSIILSILYARKQDRASIDWDSVRLKAVQIVHDLLYRTPELKELVYMPGRRLVKPHQVLPIGFGFRRSSHSRNRTRRPKAYALAKVYLEQQRSLPTISDPSKESYDELLVSKALDWVADIVDECLKAGKRPESHHVHPLQTSGMEGATAAPVLQTIFSSLTCPAMNPGMPPEAATGGSKLVSHLPTNGAPSLGTISVPVSQTVFCSLTNCSANSGVGLMPNAGAIAAPVSQTTSSGSMAHPGINPEMLSVANADAGKLASHVPTPGAPFLGNMRPPVSQTVFGGLTSRYGISGVGLMANAGPLAPVWQTMNLTNHAGSTGALVAPVSQNMFGTLTGPAGTAGRPLVENAGQSGGLALTSGAPYLVTMNAPVSQTAVRCLTSTAKNSGLSLMTKNEGAPVSPAMPIMNLASHAENSDAGH